MKVETFSAGDPLAVVAELDHDDDGNMIIVISAFKN